jgi:signal transduction histidine kinase
MRHRLPPEDRAVISARLENLSLQKKFILVTSLSIIVLMAAIGYWVVKRESRIMYDEIEKKGKLLAETLAIPMINDLIYEKLGLVEEGGLIDNYVTEMFGKEDLDLLYVAVIDADGKVISHNDFREYGKTYSDSLTMKALLAGETIIQRFHDGPSGHDAIDVATPLSIGKKRWGTIKFAISLEKLEAEIQGVVTKVAAITLVMLAVALVAIVGLSRRFMGPITQMARTMEKAGTESLDVRVDVKGRDEIAMLGQSFNDMIARIREANIELKKTHEKMYQSERLASIGVLASGVAHEINNPLGGMFNCVKMLEGRGADEEFRKQYLDLIREGLERIENTVGKMLLMSKKKEHEPTVVRVSDVIRDVHGLLDYRLQSGAIEYAEDLEDGLGVLINRQDLHQVMLNLIINAVQAMKNGGRLRVGGYRNGSSVVVSVEDTGEGISEEHINRIFDPFFTTKQPGEGTGLGLWMTYEIIKSYVGDIAVSSKQGEGTVFTVTLKAAGDDEEKPSPGN